MLKIIAKLQRKLKRGYNNNINYVTMQEMIKKNKNIYIIDVRTEDEYNNEHLKGAINIPLQDIKENIEKVILDKESIIIVYCEHGGRGQKALNKLQKMGYKNVYNLEGGIEGI